MKLTKMTFMATFQLTLIKKNKEYLQLLLNQSFKFLIWIILMILQKCLNMVLLIFIQRLNLVLVENTLPQDLLIISYTFIKQEIRQTLMTLISLNYIWWKLVSLHLIFNNRLEFLKMDMLRK